MAGSNLTIEQSGHLLGSIILELPVLKAKTLLQRCWPKFQDILWLDQLISAAAHFLKPSLLDQLVPHCRRELVGRDNGNDAGPAAAAQRAPSQVRLGVEARQLQSFLERLQSGFQIMWRWDCVGH